MRRFFEKINLNKILCCTLLAIFTAVYCYMVRTYYWSLPSPWDPSEYINAVNYGTLYGHFKFWDRLLLPLGIEIVHLFVHRIEMAGVVYQGLINFLILVISMSYAVKKAGIKAGVFTAIMVGGSYYFAVYATYIYPTQTLTLYSLMAFIAFDHGKSLTLFRAMTVGFLCACAFLTKATGIATMIFIVGYCLFINDRKGLKHIVVGFISGILIVFLISGLLYGRHSLGYLFSSSTAYINHIVNYQTGAGARIVTYWPLYVREFMLPVFVSAIICLGAYRNRVSRDLFYMALTHTICLSLFYALTSFGNNRFWGSGLVGNYAFPAYVFLAIGLSVYLAQIGENQKDGEGIDKSMIWGYLCCVLFVLGIVVSFYQRPYNEFVSMHEISLNKFMRFYYTVAPLIVVGGLAVVEYFRKPRLVLIYGLFIAFWFGVFVTGLGYSKANVIKQYAVINYDLAAVAKQVPSESFALYIRRWNNMPRHRDRNYSNFKKLYGFYFDHEQRRKFKGDPQIYTKSMADLSQRMTFLKNEEQLGRFRGGFIVSDDASDVARFFPNNIIHGKFIAGAYDYYIFKILSP